MSLRPKSQEVRAVATVRISCLRRGATLTPGPQMMPKLDVSVSFTPRKRPHLHMLDRTYGMGRMLMGVKAHLGVGSHAQNKRSGVWGENVL